jgi:predicted amidohydrolase
MYAIGTIPRKSQDKYFNTAFVVSPKGDLLTKMDKIHLFDIDIPGIFKTIDRENHL